MWEGLHSTFYSGSLINTLYMDNALYPSEYFDIFSMGDKFLVMTGKQCHHMLFTGVGRFRILGGWGATLTIFGEVQGGGISSRHITSY